VIDQVRNGFRRVPRADVALAVVVVGLTVAGTLRFASGGPALVTAAFLAGTGVLLIFRRVWPVATLAGVVAFSLAYMWWNGPNGLYLLPLGLALYSATDAGHGRLGLGCIAVLVGGIALVQLVTGSYEAELGTPVFSAGWLVASVVLGGQTRSRRALLQAAEQRAVDAERALESESLRRAGEERIRIARELHDILAHRISLISVQAGAGLHLMDRQPEQARASLAAIRQASKEALGELRTTLGVLRQVVEPEPRAPSPGLAQIDGLIDGARSAGLTVELSVDGTPRELPPGVDLAAYRIVQESLTNVIRHARAASTRIAIDYEPGELLIDVRDDGIGDGPSTSSPGGGTGLSGMRERAEALGGEIVVGSQADGGFRVRARLPIVGRA
jgi:signal transduction histidine kinase